MSAGFAGAVVVLFSSTFLAEPRKLAVFHRLLRLLQVAKGR